jgi:hypothetical protein
LLRSGLGVYDSYYRDKKVVGCLCAFFRRFVVMSRQVSISVIMALSYVYFRLSGAARSAGRYQIGVPSALFWSSATDDRQCVLAQPAIAGARVLGRCRI